MTIRMSLIVLLLAACTGATASEPTPPATEGQALADTTYVCPMHPEVTSNDPNAKCNKCGMDLVKQEKHEHDGMPHKGHDH